MSKSFIFGLIFLFLASFAYADSVTLTGPGYVTLIETICEDFHPGQSIDCEGTSVIYIPADYNKVTLERVWFDDDGFVEINGTRVFNDPNTGNCSVNPYPEFPLNANVDITSYVHEGYNTVHAKGIDNCTFPNNYQGDFSYVYVQIRIDFEEAPQPVTPQDQLSEPRTGGSNAPVTIEAYLGFQDPFSGKYFTETHDQILSKYGSDVQIIFRNFPLSFHSNAEGAAIAGECAHSQGKFWQYAEILFNNQSNLSNSALKQYASQAGLNENSFNACLDSKQYLPEVLDDLRNGENRDISGTPTFFINGQKLVGAQPFSVFENIIDEELGHNNGSNDAPSISNLPDREIEENSGYSDRLVDLWNYASDAEDSDSELSFSIVSQSSTGLIDCLIVGNRYFECFAPDRDETGTSSIVIEAEDSGGKIDTDSFDVIVFPEDELIQAPRLSKLPDKVIEENDGFQERLIDLWDYASDDEDSDSELDFRVSNQTNSSLVDCFISDDRHLECDAPRRNSTGTNLVTVVVEDTDGLEDFETARMIVERSSNGFCSDIDVETRTVFVDEEDVETADFSIRNNSGQDFFIDDVDVFESEREFDVSLVSHDTIARSDDSADLKVRVESNSVSRTEEGFGKIKVSGEFEDGRSCSFDSVGTESFRVVVENVSGGSAVCGNIKIDSFDFSLRENRTETKEIIIRNRSSKDFFVDNVQVSEDSTYLSASVRNEPTKISAFGSAKVEVRFESRAVPSRRTANVTLKVDGSFEDGKSCGFNDIKLTDRITILNTGDAVEADDIEVNVSPASISLEPGRLKKITVGVENNSNSSECFDLSVSSNSASIEASLEDSEFCLSRDNDKEIELTVKALSSARPGNYTVTFKAEGDFPAIINLVKVNVLGEEPRPAEPELEVFGLPQVVELSSSQSKQFSFSIKNNSSSIMTNVVVSIANLPEKVAFEPIVRQQLGARETINVTGTINAAGAEEQDFTALLEVESDQARAVEAFKVSVEAPADEGEEPGLISGLLGLAGSVGLGIILLIILIIVIAIIVALVRK